MLDQSLLGYVPYLLMVFLPGLGLGELLGIWRDGSSFVERVAMAFGLGLAVDTLVLFLWTSGPTLFGLRQFGMDLDSVYLIIGLGAVFLFAGLTIRREFRFYVELQRIDLAVFLVIVGLGAMMAAFFAKYPIFPEYQSADFATHVSFSTGLIAGAPFSQSVVLYYGVEYQLAASILMVGGQALVTIRDTMALLVVLSPLLIYLASVRLFSNKVSALLATVIYAFSGTLWFGSVFNSGLYANFFGLLASLFLITAFVEVATNLRSKAYWLFFLAALFMAYMSHYSTLTVLPAILMAALLQYTFHRNDVAEGRKYIIPAIITLIPVAMLAAVYPSLVQRVLSLATEGGGSVIGGTTLSTLLTSVPVLQYMAVEVYDDVAFVVLLLLAAVYVYRSGGARKGLLFLPVFWFFAVVLTSPENLNAWRFAFAAILPLTLMAGQGISYLFPREVLIATTKKRSGRMSGRANITKAAFVAILFVCLLVVGSWGTTMLSDSFTLPQTNAQAQNDVYQAILWIGNNTPPGSSYLSVSDWRFTYTSLMIGRNSIYQFESTPANAISAAKVDGAGYIIVTNVVTVSLLPIPSLFPWNNFPSSSNSNLTLVYTNSDVRIYQLT
jgi:hypothetical protein